jgi:hypothetical protein
MRPTLSLLIPLCCYPLLCGAQHAPEFEAGLDTLAASVEARFAEQGYAGSAAPPTVIVDSTPQLSYFVAQENAVHTSQWRAVAPEWQQTFNRWAALAGGQLSGEQLCGDTLNKFFFVHEIGHWAQSLYEPRAGSLHVNSYEYELEADRLAVAYWRSEDPAFLNALMRNYRLITAKLPSPVPRGETPKQYFAENFRAVAANPDAYGWYKFDTALRAYEETPAPTLQKLLKRLPKMAYD